MHNSERPFDRRRTRLSRFSWLLPLGLLGCGDLDPALDDLGAVETKTSALTSYAQNALLITDLTVVRDATRTSDPCDSVAGEENRVWTIGHMLKQEAQRQGKTSQQYVSGWLDAWATAGPTINGQFLTTDVLEGPSVRSSWAKDSQGNYLLHKAPLKLLAIVSRLDLRMIRPLGEPLGGEVRFVFAPMQPPLTPVSPTPADGRCMTTANDISTIILEYSPVRKDENAVVDWAKRWHALGLMQMGSSTYLTELANLTEDVITNGRLLRIRTNENTSGTWKLTEFEHDGTTKLLKRSTIKQSPTEALHTQNSTILGNWIKDSRERLRSLEGRRRTDPFLPVANYMVPDTYAGTQLRGSFNDNGSDELGYWNATNPGIWQGDWDEARHLFSMATCSGCHGRETNTGFLHIKANNSGAADLSPFLSGPHSVTDPVTGTVRQFDEMARRQEDLSWLATGQWVGVPVVRNSYTGGKNAAMNYKLVFMHSAKCMDVVGNSLNDGALVQQYTCHGRDNQRVAIVDQGQSVYSFVFKHSGKCLEVKGASTTNGARLVQRTCSTSALNQKLAMWFSASQTGRFFKFLHSQMCIQVQNASTANSAPVVQATCPEGDDPLSAKFVE